MKNDMKTNSIKNLAILGATFLSMLNAPALDEQCNSCARPVLINGDYYHLDKPGEVKLVGASDPSIYWNELNGSAFTVTVPNLPAGKYVAEFLLAETHLTNSGLRSFDIRCGDKVLAQNLDVFKSSGGLGHVYSVRATVEHAEDAIGGPLTFSFVGRKNHAFLNGFNLLAADGSQLVSTKAMELVPAMSEWARKIPVVNGPVIYTNTAYPFEPRAADLVARMSLAEKVAQLNNAAPAVRRLNVPAYNYWNECLHGVGRAGIATVFPQAIGMAASWDDVLLKQVADVISTEARAKHNGALAKSANGDCSWYFGLTFWTPNINIFRDPRWGRGQETYGEDPFLTTQMGLSFIRGLQGDDPRYLKAAACAKHFAVHSGPEPLRFGFPAAPPEWDFYDTYLPQFEAAVREAKVESVMGAYNKVYGEPVCASKLLLTQILRERWGFKGHVTSDCGAITYISKGGNIAPTPEAGAAMAVGAGCDLCCGKDYFALAKAVDEKLIAPEQVDQALKRVLTTRFRLGMFDPPADVPFSHIPASENDTPAHGELALKMARESLVLLKNDGTLPLDRRLLKRIVVIGANADSVDMLLGNYHGTPSHPITILQGITNLAGTNIEVMFHPGVALVAKVGEPAPDFSAAVDLARSADVVIYVGGINASLECEQAKVDFVGFNGGDRTTIELPGNQELLLKALKKTGRPVVMVNCSGSAMAMLWADENLNAILQAWYPGQSGGQAVAEALFGDYNPGGKLPVTFYRATADLPEITDYSMSSRTYRYFGGQPLYAFGHGLSYTQFKLDKVQASGELSCNSGVARVTFRLANIGQRDGDEVVQIYLRELQSRPHQPRQQLCGFRRISVAAGEQANGEIAIPVRCFRHWDAARSDYVVDPGNYELLVGMASDAIAARCKVEIH